MIKVTKKDGTTHIVPASNKDEIIRLFGKDVKIENHSPEAPAANAKPAEKEKQVKAPAANAKPAEKEKQVKAPAANAKPAV